MRLAIILAGFGIVMLLTGSANTLLKKVQNMTVVGTTPEGKDIKYSEPIWQAVTMFVAEALCSLVYFALRIPAQRAIKRLRAEGPEAGAPNPALNGVMGVAAAVEKPALPLKKHFYFALPALCDACATTLNLIGLLKCATSVYQMLRGFLIIVTSIFTVVFIKKHLHRYKWLGVFMILVGLTIVGLVAVLSSQGSSQVDTEALGVALILIAQVFSASQFIIEEKILTLYSCAPIKAVALEGTFGLMIMAVLFPLGYGIGIWADLSDSTRREFGILNPMEGLKQTMTITRVWLPNLFIVFSISTFNITGMAIARMLSSAARSTVDALRTMVVWMVSLLALSEPFRPWTIPGFILLTLGAFVFNDVIRIPLRGWSKNTLTEAQIEKAAKADRLREAAAQKYVEVEAGYDEKDALLNDERGTAAV